MAIDTIKFKRGVKSKLNNLSYGEPAYISDENELYIGTENGVEKITRNKEVAELSSQLEHIENKVQNNKKVNALDLGVKNDGSDTTVELQNAINYCFINKCPLYLPAGRYMITQSVTIPGYSIILGDGKERTIIETSKAIDVLILNNSSTSTEGAYGIEISDICISGKNIANIGINLHYTRESIVRNVKVIGCTIGIKLEQAWSNSITSSRIINNTTNLFLGNQSNDLNLIDNCFDNAGENGVYVAQDSQVINFNGCVIQNCGHNGVLLDDGRSVAFNSCYFELNNKSESTDKYDINVRGANSNVIGLTVQGSGFWCDKVTGAINIDRCMGATIIGGYILPTGTQSVQYGISVTSNSHYVTEYNVYKEKVVNNDANGIIFNPIRPVYKDSNITMSKEYPIITVNTPTKYKDPSIVFSTENKIMAKIATYGEGFHIYSTSKATGNLEEIIKIHDNNFFVMFFKNLYMPECGISDSKMVKTGYLELKSTTANTTPNNCLFIDSSDNKLKFKDNSGVLNVISSS